MLLSGQVERRTSELRAEIEEHRKSELTLADERMKLKSILDAMPYGVFMVDRDYAIQYINPALEAEFGPVTGKKCFEYFNSGSSPCTWCKNEPVFSGQSVEWEWTSARTGRTYLLYDIPVRNPDGSIYKLGIFQDITERKHFEAERKVAYARIEDNMREMAILNDEIRNPLSVIIAVADMLSYPDGEMIKKQGKVIDSIISTLDLGFLESEKVRSFLQRHARFDKRGEETKK